MAVPVLGIPVLNRADLLHRCIRSVDYPVEEIVVVNNGKDPAVAALLAQLRLQYRNLTVERPDHNLGVSGSWNWIMRSRPESFYWLICGSDMMFTSGDLALIDEGIRRHPEMVLRPANWGHSLFAIRPHCLETAGFFDENFYPAYLEDSDHLRRINLLGLPWADIGKAPDETERVKAIHGEAPTWGSHSIYGSPALRKANGVSHHNNFLYYHRKWGGGPGQETFTRPYNIPVAKVSDWQLDPAMREANEAAWREAL